MNRKSVVVALMLTLAGFSFVLITTSPSVSLSSGLSIDASSPPLKVVRGPDNSTPLAATTAGFSPPANSLLVAQTTANNPITSEEASQVV